MLFRRKGVVTPVNVLKKVDKRGRRSTCRRSKES